MNLPLYSPTSNLLSPLFLYVLHLHPASPSVRNLIILLKYASSLQGRGRQRNTMGHKGITSLSDSSIVGISISLYFVGKISLSPCRDALFILFSFLSLSKTRRESSRHPSYSLAYCKELKYSR